MKQYTGNVMLAALMLLVMVVLMAMLFTLQSCCPCRKEAYYKFGRGNHKMTSACKKVHKAYEKCRSCAWIQYRKEEEQDKN